LYRQFFQTPRLGGPPCSLAARYGSTAKAEGVMFCTGIRCEKSTALLRSKD
jgi:predicted sulfurtransferase